MTDRSSRPDVRNPLLVLPAFGLLQSLPPEAKAALRAILLDIRRDALERAQRSWAQHKAPMAFYWKVVAVYAYHTSRALRPSRAEPLRRAA